MIFLGHSGTNLFCFSSMRRRAAPAVAFGLHSARRSVHGIPRGRRNPQSKTFPLEIDGRFEPNFRVLQLAGSFGLNAIRSPRNDNPQNRRSPSTTCRRELPCTAHQRSLCGYLSDRSPPHAGNTAVRGPSRPSRAATSPCIAPLRELP
jgi:hypothetical protein